MMRCDKYINRPKYLHEVKDTFFMRLNWVEILTVISM